ncbi:complex I subunit 5 family protein [Desulfuromonas sp. AOP6]|uniref:complex I subunit 5 family protein n=1 Tax=Desulfuromonas sp. AOP6 TaxID=1566351 RepID=UPI001275627D|nr:complex I subunit 5 family protein [Desulfuromonas sp. AOP6]BCA78461.1 hypothetical protein AOP6_0248 [Desulfuromonas sp. AOP6]
MDPLMEALFSQAVWLAVLAFPLLLAGGCLCRRGRQWAVAAAPWSALPAIILAIWPPAAGDYPWLLLGSIFSLDLTGRIFLLFTALVWGSSALYARGYLVNPARLQFFFFFFLLAMTGNLGLIMAGDMASFYLFFALMTFAAYGLVVHERDAEARQAGKVYLVMAVLGEVLLIAGLMLIASEGTTRLADIAPRIAVSPHRHLIIGLVLTGFGIKAGCFPLHLWLPLAHPAAPTPASAVLSGAMIKAGLLAWLRFLPLGEAAFPAWGMVCLVAGLIAAFGGVALGLAQSQAKTVLAYSSISQMGLMTGALGLGLFFPAAWPSVLAALCLYALHHGLAKTALFLGVGMAGAGGVWARRVFLAGLLWPALSLAGAPLTSGLVAKKLLGGLAVFIPSPWGEVFTWTLAGSAAATALLMAYLLLLPWTQRSRDRCPPTPRQWLAWGLAQLGGLYLVWKVVPGWLAPWGAKSPGWSNEAALSVLVGAVVGFLFWRLAKKSRSSLLPPLPAGDMLLLLYALGRGARQGWANYGDPAVTRLVRAYLTFVWQGPIELFGLHSLLAASEKGLLRWRVSGGLFLLLVLAFAVMLLR